MAFDETNPLTERVRPYVEQLKAASKAGDQRALEVINLYQMYRAFPEQGAMGLCNAALDDWLLKRKSTSR